MTNEWGKIKLESERKEGRKTHKAGFLSTHKHTRYPSIISSYLFTPKTNLLSAAFLQSIQYLINYIKKKKARFFLVGFWFYSTYAFGNLQVLRFD
ncbi:hypothetical protein L6452_21374 [Arctium lappa]|uniref:Uncharacterized protein n=1 Tax=Arctium lappa TaxID=4217 RepID=A0ACB9BDY4_ARCLA|nr:hypothetical protein L6452_21374 [Arctium lappa]